jgi:hypothetical protein
VCLLHSRFIENHLIWNLEDGPLISKVVLSHPSKTPMVVRALEKDTDPFRSCQEGEEVLCFEYSYLNAIRTLMYLLNNTRPDIAFAVNLLIRYSAAPTMCHWNGVKNVL